MSAEMSSPKRPIAALRVLDYEACDWLDTVFGLLIGFIAHL
jgi:hypothetical protein